MVEDESSVDAFKDFTIDDAGGKKATAKPSDEQEPPPKEEKEDKPPKEEKKEPAPPPKPAKDDSSSTTPDFGGPILASPIARRLALENGIPLKQIKGTGPGGRIIKSDIQKYQPTTSADSSPASSPTGTQPAVLGAGGYTDIPITGMRRTIAKRLSESMFTAPHYY